MTLDESWQRHPDARVRLREGDLDNLVKALQGGIFLGSQPRVQLVDGGILIGFGANASKSDNTRMASLPIDVFIPCDTDVVAEVVPEPETQVVP